MSSVNAFDYGLIADGQPHPISELFQTIEQAQAAWPDLAERQAFALTDQIDWAALQSATYAAAKRTFGRSGTNAAAWLSLGHGRAVINRTLNWTNLRSRGLCFDSRGLTIVPQLDDPSKTVIDMIATRDLTVEGLNIAGTPDHPAAFGMAIGRHGEGGEVPGSPSNAFVNCKWNGHFTKGTFYNFASELCQFDRCMFANTAPDAHAYIGDGMYHWKYKSDFVEIVARPDVEQPFTVNSFKQCEWLCNGDQSPGRTTSPIWLACTKGHYFEGYISANTGGDHCTAVTLYSAVPEDENCNLTLNIHDEGMMPPGLQHNIRFDGPNPHQVIFNLKKTDVSSGAVMFGKAPKVKSVSLVGAEIKIGNQGVTTRKAFDTPAFYTVSGVVALDQSRAAGFWNLPDRLFQGQLTILWANRVVKTRFLPPD